MFIENYARDDTFYNFYSQTACIHNCRLFTLAFLSLLSCFTIIFFLFKYMHTLKCPHYSIKSCTSATYKNIYTHFFLNKNAFLLVAHEFYKVV